MTPRTVVACVAAAVVLAVIVLAAVFADADAALPIPANGQDDTQADPGVMTVAATNTGIVAPQPPGAADGALRQMSLQDRRSIAGQALNAATLSVPPGWRPMAYVDGLASNDCQWTAGGCPLWLLASADGLSSVEILEPRRRLEFIAAKGGSAEIGRRQRAMALELLEEFARLRLSDMRIIASSAQAEPHRGVIVPAGPRRSLAAAWLLVGYSQDGRDMRELLATTLSMHDVSSSGERGRTLRVEVLPTLILRMPASRFDAATAETMRASLAFDPGWLPQWWRAYEADVISSKCGGIGATADGLCRLDPHPHLSYFVSLESLGVWDREPAP